MGHDGATIFCLCDKIITETLLFSWRNSPHEGQALCFVALCAQALNKGVLIVLFAQALKGPNLPCMRSRKWMPHQSVADFWSFYGGHFTIGLAFFLKLDRLSTCTVFGVFNGNVRKSYAPVLVVYETKAIKAPEVQCLRCDIILRWGVFSSGLHDVFPLCRHGIRRHICSGVFPFFPLYFIMSKTLDTKNKIKPKKKQRTRVQYGGTLELAP